MGSGRGSAETGFIRSVDHAVDRFYGSVVTHLGQFEQRRPARTRQAAEPVGVG